jgi:hypothetical protein
MALIRADGAQPSLHLDEYVRARTVYIYGLVALLDSRIKLLAISISTTTIATTTNRFSPKCARFRVYFGILPFPQQRSQIKLMAW